MTTTLFNNLFRLCILFLVFSVPPAFSQIVCTDVNPDISAVGNYTQDIDLNNDATPDFRITGAQTGTFSMALAQAQQIGTGNSVLGTGGGEAQALIAGTVIDGNATTWVQMNSGNQIMALQAGTTLIGPWIGATDLYLGLKLIINSNTHYGWARFSFYSPANSYTFKDYAYNSIPNQQILAGQGCGSPAYPVFSITPQLCVGSAATLVANTGSQAATNYVWASVGGGAVFTPSNTVNTAVTFSAPGTYTILLVTITSGTIGIMQNTVEVGFTPTLTSNAPICSGETLTLSVTGGTSYAWNGPLGFTSSGATTSINSASVNNSGTYSVLVTSAIGCTAIATSQIIVKVLPLITITPPSGTVCTSGTALPLQASGTSSGLLWIPPNGLSATTGSNVNAFPSANTIYTVIGMSSNGCTNIATVPVNVEAPATFTLIQSANSLCAQGHNGSPANVTITLVGGNNYLTSVNNSSALGSLTAGMTTIYNSMSPYSNVPVSATSTIVAYNGICSVAFPVSITVISNPTVTIFNPLATICEGDAVTLTAGGATDYTWDNTVPGLNTYTGGAVVASPTVTTIFALYGSKAGCASASVQQTVNVNPKPVLSATDRTVCINAPATLTVAGAASYQWSGPGGFSSTNASAQVPGSSGAGIKVYTVTGTTAKNCVATKMVSLYADQCTGLYSSEKENEFVLFPNPFNSTLRISSASNMGSIQVTVRDVTGKIVAEANISYEDENKILDLSALPEGIFIVSLKTEEKETKTYRVTKQ